MAVEPTSSTLEAFTTIGGRWTRGSSRTHIVLAQIEEWYHDSLAGIREVSGSTEYRELVIEPRGWSAT